MLLSVDFVKATPMACLMSVLLVIMTALYFREKKRCDRAEREVAAAVERGADQSAAPRDAAPRQVDTKMRFLSLVSHELRTPMAGIVGLADLMLRSDLSHWSSEQRDNLRIIHDSSVGLNNLLDSVLDLARIESGKLTLLPGHFSLIDFVLGVVLLFQGAVQMKSAGRLRIVVELDPSIAAATCVVADAQRIRQVLLNLVGNSVKYSKNGVVVLRVGVGERRLADDARNTVADLSLPTVSHFGETKIETIDAAAAADAAADAADDAAPSLSVWFEVEDTGVGIAKDEQAEVFNAFSRVSESQNAKILGTGLGMSVVALFVRLYSGQLAVESAGRGCGATFKVVLRVSPCAEPLHDAPDQATTRAAAALVTHVADDELCLIVVESNALVQRALRHTMLAMLRQLTSADFVARRVRVICVERCSRTIDEFMSAMRRGARIVAFVTAPERNSRCARFLRAVSANTVHFHYWSNDDELARMEAEAATARTDDEHEAGLDAVTTRAIVEVLAAQRAARGAEPDDDAVAKAALEASTPSFADSRGSSRRSSQQSSGQQQALRLNPVFSADALLAVLCDVFALRFEQDEVRASHRLSDEGSFVIEAKSASLAYAGVEHVEERQSGVYFHHKPSSSSSTSSSHSLSLSPRALNALAGCRRVRKPSGASSSSSSASASSASASPCVLVCEDNAVNRIVSQRFMTRLGVACVFAKDGEEALAMATGDVKYNAIFMDDRMPGWSGREVVRMIRERACVNQRAKICALTANASQDDRDAFLAAGADGFLQKPMQLQDVERVLLRFGVTLTCPTTAADVKAPRSHHR